MPATAQSPEQAAGDLAALRFAWTHANCRSCQEDIFGDGGALKELRKATDGRPPRPGDECQITYEAGMPREVSVEAFGI